MSDQIRAWKVIKSFELALIVGSLAGLMTTGLFCNHLAGNLEPRASLLVGVGVGAGLTLILTYVFDRVSKLVGDFRRAVEGKRRKGGLRKERQKGDTSLPRQ
jgi:hypothetical protein